MPISNVPWRHVVSPVMASTMQPVQAMANGSSGFLTQYAVYEQRDQLDCRERQPN